MLKLSLLVALGCFLIAPEASAVIPHRTRFLRENLYNFRPQSAVIDDELDFRSFDNSFSPFNEDLRGNYAFKPLPVIQSRANAGGFTVAPPLAVHRSPFIDPPQQAYNGGGGGGAGAGGCNTCGGEDDYADEGDDAEDAVDFTPQTLSPKRRPQGGGGGGGRAPPQGNPPILAQWDDQSGRQRGDSSYSFGFRTPDQSRRESADVFGNVNGDFTFIDDEGVLRKVVYSSGAHKGFVVNSKSPADAQQSHTGQHRRAHHRRPHQYVLTEAPRVRPPSRRQFKLHHRQNPPPTIISTVPDAQPSNVGNQLPKSTSVFKFKHSTPVAVNTVHGDPSDGQQQANDEGVEPIHNINVASDPAEGNTAVTKPWGVLGQTPRPRPGMRKRKPALVVKVKRPATTTTAAPPPPVLPDYDSSSADYYDSDIDNEIEDPYSQKDKSYSFGYSTGDQQREEVSDAYGNVRGSYSYVDPSGVTRTVHYSAGNAGFKVLNAQPSNLRPVTIPLPVMARLQQIATESSTAQQKLPLIKQKQPSAIVYHIHPTNGQGADWKPWESKRVVKTVPTKRLRRKRPKTQYLEPLQQATTVVQGNTFHLTPSNDRFFPAYSSIYQSQRPRVSRLVQEAPRMLMTSDTPDYDEIVIDDPAVFALLQKRFKLKPAVQNQILSSQPYYSSWSPPQSAPYYQPSRKSSRLNYIDQLANHFITEPGDDSLGVFDDKIYSDYEIAAAIVEAENARLQGSKRSGGKGRVYKKTRMVKVTKMPKSSKASSSSSSAPTSVSAPVSAQQALKAAMMSPATANPTSSTSSTRRMSSSSATSMRMASSTASSTRVSAASTPSATKPTMSTMIPTTEHDFITEEAMNMAYQAGYGEKSPLLMETTPGATIQPTRMTSMNTVKPSQATRSQRQAPRSRSMERMALMSSEAIPDQMMAESFAPMMEDMVVAMPLTMMMTSTEVNQGSSNTATEENMTEKLTKNKKSPASDTSDVPMSPQARLTARMASATAPTTPSSQTSSSGMMMASESHSISAIAMPTLMSNAGKLMHFPSGTIEVVKPDQNDT